MEDVAAIYEWNFDTLDQVTTINIFEITFN